MYSGLLYILAHSMNMRSRSPGDITVSAWKFGLLQTTNIYDVGSIIGWGYINISAKIVPLLIITLLRRLNIGEADDASFSCAKIAQIAANSLRWCMGWASKPLISIQYPLEHLLRFCQISLRFVEISNGRKAYFTTNLPVWHILAPVDKTRL